MLNKQLEDALYVYELNRQAWGLPIVPTSLLPVIRGTAKDTWLHRIAVFLGAQIFHQRNGKRDLKPLNRYGSAITVTF